MARRKRKEEDERNELDEWFSWPWPRRRGFPFGFDIFDDLEEQFRRDWEQMNRFMRQAMRGDLPEPEKGGPYVYGWSLRVGPDGKPHFQEFGNVPEERRLGGATEGMKRREPLVDVVEEDDAITITAEVPGVDKKDIDLEITEDTLTISVDKEERPYYKEIRLPAEVDHDSAQASYQNGILDIELKKAKKAKKGKKIDLK
ncbi:MAG TPA: Hsp20/alpha crystallin family protein [Thermoplasmatales archaeon]|nr:Hsp20/alpha crystallin family protein [Candidatus Thermoplasmatota archaeon]MDD5778703.1 Hsp20/alpha crystallin family protein [Candidatus Thermoplasmatota archaeon]HDS59224.1 Hsp20/alpha crystallin family protein [Thermoplasmatales archaeon]